jgi:hypothetical protein
MIRAIFIIFTVLTVASIALTYQGVGLQEVESIKKETHHRSIRHSSHSSSYSSGYSGGFSSGK